MSSVIIGLEQLIQTKPLQNRIKGNVAYLCHSASIDRNFHSGIDHVKNIFGKRLIKLFGPQHGIRSDVQDNMVESDHFHHPYYDLPVYSLYSETRVPTDSMLEGIDSFIVDLQDVGTRVYTYISTLGLLMEKCQGMGIKIIILDRPNPIGGKIIEGNVLNKNLQSFVGQYEIPMRHGLTIGEFARWVQNFHAPDVDLNVIPMVNWSREMMFPETGLPWVNPSPNLPTFEGALVYPGSVLFEGTNLSEGRGTTRSLEIIGHPKLNAFSFADDMRDVFRNHNLTGFEIRAIEFIPTFQKHAGKICGGIQIHPTNPQEFRPWQVSQVLMQKLFNLHLTNVFWNKNPYEYEFENIAIDLLNGDERIRTYIEKNQSFQTLLDIENERRDHYLDQIQDVLLY